MRRLYTCLWTPLTRSTWRTYRTSTRRTSTTLTWYRSVRWSTSRATTSPSASMTPPIPRECGERDNITPHVSVEGERGGRERGGSARRRSLLGTRKCSRVTFEHLRLRIRFRARISVPASCKFWWLLLQFFFSSTAPALASRPFLRWRNRIVERNVFLHSFSHQGKFLLFRFFDALLSFPLLVTLKKQ